MKFKVGEVYKSNTTNQLYRYVGKHQDDGFLKFERASGCHIGILDEFTTSYAESVLERQVETKEDKKMQFKVGKSYKSNQSGAVYKYLGKSQGNAHLNFEIVSGGSVGELTQFTIKYAEITLKLQVEQGEEKAPEVPVFVKATLDEAITAFKEGNKSDFYMYNPKKGICTPLVKETNILMLTTWTILKKVGE